MSNFTVLPKLDAARRQIGVFYAMFGTLLGTLSILKLIERSLARTFSDTLQLLVNTYDEIIQRLFGWAEPLVHDGLQRIGLDLMLEPHWKHVVVLLGLYFSRNIVVTWSTRGPGTAVVRAIWGTLIAALTGIGVGTVSVLDQDVFAHSLIALLPLLGATLFDLGNDLWGAVWFRGKNSTMWQYFKFEARFVVLRAVVGTLIVAGVLTIPQVAQSPSPGLVALGVLFLSLAFYWIWLGTSWPARNRSGDNWRATIGRNGASQLGLSMLACLSAAMLLVAVDAGSTIPVNP